MMVSSAKIATWCLLSACGFVAIYSLLFSEFDLLLYRHRFISFAMSHADRQMLNRTTIGNSTLTNERGTVYSEYNATNIATIGNNIATGGNNVTNIITTSIGNKTTGISKTTTNRGNDTNNRGSNTTNMGNNTTNRRNNTTNRRNNTTNRKNNTTNRRNNTTNRRNNTTNRRNNTTNRRNNTTNRGNNTTNRGNNTTNRRNNTTNRGNDTTNRGNNTTNRGNNTTNMGNNTTNRGNNTTNRGNNTTNRGNNTTNRGNNTTNRGNNTTNRGNNTTNRGNNTTNRGNNTTNRGNDTTNFNSVMTENETTNTENNTTNTNQEKQLPFLQLLVRKEMHRKSVINCTAIFQNNATEIALAKTLKYKNYGNENFIKATEDCVNYKRLRNYRTYRDVTDRERSYPLAYSILVHHDIDGFERLLRAIYRPHNVYCVHVDRKSPTLFFDAVSNITRCFLNVFLASKREIVVYGGFTRLQADLNCFADLLAYDWKYVLNYAGTELPLRPNNQLVEILRLYNNSNIVERIMKQNVHRWSNTYITSTNRSSNEGRVVFVRRGNIAAPFGVHMTKGSAYGVFSRAFAEYVVHDNVARTFLAWCESTYSPDEHFWATLNNGVENAHLKAPGALRGVLPPGEYIARYVSWYPITCTGNIVRHICVFGVGDLHSLVDKPHLVANKFSLTTSATAVDCVEELLDDRHRLGSLESGEKEIYTKNAFVVNGIH